MEDRYLEEFYILHMFANVKYKTCKQTDKTAAI